MKRLSSIMIILLLLTFSLIMPAAAAESARDIEAVISTDKSDYESGEDVNIQLNVKNTGISAVGAVHVKITLPDEVKLKDGYLAEDDVDLLAGEEKSYVIVASVPTASDSSETSSSPETLKAEAASVSDNAQTVSTTVYSDSESSAEASDAREQQSPATGDRTNIAFWIIMAVVSGAMLTVLVMVAVRHEKKSKKLLSLMVCAVLAGSMTVPVAVRADNSGKKEKTLTVTQEITAGGKKVNIKADISYILPDQDKNYDNEYADNWDF